MDIGTMYPPVDRAPGVTRPLVELYDDAIDRIVQDERMGFDCMTC